MTKIIKLGKSIVWSFYCQDCGCEFQTDSIDKKLRTEYVSTSNLLANYLIGLPENDITKNTFKSFEKSSIKTAFMPCPCCGNLCASISQHSVKEE